VRPRGPGRAAGPRRLPRQRHDPALPEAAPARPYRWRRGMSPAQSPSAADAEDILRRCLASADVIGDSPTGGAFLMIEAPADLLDRLASFGADAEDGEDDDPAEEDDVGEDDGRRFPVDNREPWPPSR